MQVLIELGVDKSLMPELATMGFGLGSKLFGNVVNDV